MSTWEKYVNILSNLIYIRKKKNNTFLTTKVLVISKGWGWGKNRALPCPLVLIWGTVIL